MKTLFIIGNGIDIDHKLKTRWKEIFEDFFDSLCLTQNKNNFLLRYFLKNKKDLWADFEGQLSKIFHSIAGWFYPENEWKSKKLNKNDQEEINAHLLKMFESIKAVNDHIKNTSTSSYDAAKSFIEKKLKDNELFKKDTPLIEIKNHLIDSIITIIQEGITICECQKKEIIAFYKEIFKTHNDDYFVINYNYTTFYENGEYEYYNKNNAWHIHGSFTKKDIETFNENSLRREEKDNGWRQELQSKILFGTYGLLSGESKKYFVEEDKESSVILRRYLLEFEKDFEKEKNEKLEEYKPKIEEEYEKLVIIGHSISKNDMNFLFKQNLNINNLKEIHVVNYWEHNFCNLHCEEFIKIKNTLLQNIKENLFNDKQKKLNNSLKIKLWNTYDRKNISFIENKGEKWACKTCHIKKKEN